MPPGSAEKLKSAPGSAEKLKAPMMRHQQQAQPRMSGSGGDIDRAPDQRPGRIPTGKGPPTPSRAAWPSPANISSGGGSGGHPGVAGAAVSHDPRPPVSLPQTPVRAPQQASSGPPLGVGAQSPHPPRQLGGNQVEALMRDVAARIIQTYWRAWKAWKGKVRG